MEGDNIVHANTFRLVALKSLFLNLSNKQHTTSIKLIELNALTKTPLMRCIR